MYIYLNQSVRGCLWVSEVSRGGHSHRRRSHSYDRGQEVVKWSRTIFKLGKVVKMQFQMVHIFMAINIRNGKRSSS